MDAISVCLCDPQPVVRQGFEAMLADSKEFVLSGACVDLKQAVALAETERPDVLILDRSFGMQSVREVVAAMSARRPDTVVVLWASNISDVECFRALQSGVRGVMKKTIELDSLRDCLRSVARNQLWTENLSAVGDLDLQSQRSRPLTPREKEVAALVSKGLKNREIAEQLGIATGTVKIHLMHIFEKTGIRDRFELALHGLKIASQKEMARQEPTAVSA